MQSLMEFRRFGRQAQQQYDRDVQKAKALVRGNAEARNDQAPVANTKKQDRPASVDSSDSTVRGEMDDTRDAEKGEHAATGSNTSDESIPLEQRRTSSGSQLGRSQSFGTRLGTTLSGIEVRTLTKEIARTRTKKGKGNSETEKTGGEERDKVFVVGYESNKDLSNPHNWPLSTRIGTTMLVALIALVVGYAASIDASVLMGASMEFGVSTVVESLATGIYLVGFGVGAFFAGPISETVGRNPVYITTMILFMIFIMASALAPNIGAQLAFRFIAGFFGSTPLVCAGGSLSDLWDPLERVYAFPIFANAGFLGPVISPVIGGYIAQYAPTWRWTEWSTLIFAGITTALLIFLMPETYAPILLSWKSKHLRRITGDDRYVAEVEIRADSFGTRLLHALYRPFLITVREPIVMLFALYLTVVYIILFTFFDGYTNIFGDTYGFDDGSVGLCFLGIAVGLFGATAIVPFIHRRAKRSLAKVKEEGGNNLPPEQRLLYAMIGAPFIPVSLFWMAWTTNPSISYWSPLIASVFFGFGILTIFISSYQYIIDSYEQYSASALASLTLIRYVAAGGMVVVGIPFYANLGVHLTVTILGAISALMVPVPYLFYAYGPKIRSYSHYAKNL